MPAFLVMASPLRQSPGAGTKARCAIGALGSYPSTPLPKGLGHRIAVGGPGIASACTVMTQRGRAPSREPQCSANSRARLNGGRHVGGLDPREFLGRHLRSFRQTLPHLYQQRRNSQSACASRERQHHRLRCMPRDGLIQSPTSDQAIGSGDDDHRSSAPTPEIDNLIKHRFSDPILVRKPYCTGNPSQPRAPQPLPFTHHETQSCTGRNHMTRGGTHQYGRHDNLINSGVS
jgi:hypothetical protein